MAEQKKAEGIFVILFMIKFNEFLRNFLKNVGSVWNPNSWHWYFTAQF